MIAPSPVPERGTAAGARATDITVEHHAPAAPGHRIIGVGTSTPRLSWTIDSADEHWLPERYELEISVDAQIHHVVVSAARHVLVPWPLAPLRSRQQVSVRVRLGTKEQWAGWSATVDFETGLLSPDDWTGVGIGVVQPNGRLDPAPLLRTTFHVPAGASSARLRIACLGLYSATINGAPVTASVLDPGWTSYHHRRRSRSYDVTDLVVSGDNEIEIVLGNGWYRGRLGFQGKDAVYGPDLVVRAQLEIVHADGSMIVGTNEGWTAIESTIRKDDLYDGQTTDLRPSPEVALTVVPRTFDTSLLQPTADAPVRRLLTVAPSDLRWEDDGRLIVDFGQNVVGWVRLAVRVGDSSTVTVRHAEVLQGGELAVEPLGTAEATDRYLLPAEFTGSLEPGFTFHGFRFAEISGLDPASIDAVDAVVIGTDMPRTGWFDTDHDLLNRLHENIIWSMRGNFVDIPTDCPQRAERLGWTADIQVFAPSALFLFDCTDLLSGWLTDLAHEQRPDGAVPWTIPSVFDDDPAAAGWSDAAVIVPWAIYESTGDEEILSRQFPSICAWVDYVHRQLASDGAWRGGFQFGDWLDPSAPPDDPFQATTDPDLVATACYARSVQLASEIATILGRDDAAERYRERATQARSAFAENFIAPRGRLTSDTVAAYSMALNWDLLPHPSQREVAATRLGDLVRASGFRITTGFLGTPLVLSALAESGQSALAIRLLLQTACPSWLYPVTMGATTVWERWDSMLPDGTLNPGPMTSFNHFALGAVAQWLHRSLAGLAPAEPGWRRIDVRPVFTPALGWVSAEHTTPYGRAAVAHQRTPGGYRLQIDVPHGTVADLHLPHLHEPLTVRAGMHVVDVPMLDPVERPVVDPTVRDVIDDEVLWSDIVVAVAEAGLGDETTLARSAAPYLDQPAQALIAAMTRFGGSPARTAALRTRLTDLLVAGTYPGRTAPPRELSTPA